MLPRRWRGGDLLYLLLAAACVLPLYWPSLHYDLFQDDFYLLRPWPPEHLIGVWTGGWFVPQSQDFYRPFAIWLYKALFYPFGLNTRVLHVLPLLILSALAWMVGRFVRIESGDTRLGALAVVLTVVHPMTTVAAGAWIANQYQALVGIGMMGTLLWWQHCRDRSFVWWWPLALPIILAAFTKETGLMVPLIVVAIHTGRTLWVRDLAAPTRWWYLAAVGGLFVGLIGWRAFMLGGVGGYEPSTPRLVIIGQYVNAYWAVLVEPVRMMDAAVTKWLFAGASLLGTGAGLFALLRRRPTVPATLALEGLVILAAMAIPTAVVFSRDRLMPHPIGAVLMLTAGAALAARLPTAWRALAAATATVGVTAGVLLTSTALTRFDPCLSVQLSDPYVLLEEARTVPPEMIRWLDFLGKNGCSAEAHAPLFTATQRLTWGVREQDGHLPSYERRHVWARARIVALLDQRAVQVNVRVRHPGASATTPVPIHLVADGGTEFTVDLVSPEWRDILVPLSDTLLTWTRQMHRLELTVPEEFVPGVEMRPLDLIYPK